jgi:hypothetical protein
MEDNHIVTTWVNHGVVVEVVDVILNVTFEAKHETWSYLQGLGLRL